MKTRAQRSKAALGMLTLYSYGLVGITIFFWWRKMVSENMMMAIILVAFLIRSLYFAAEAIILSLPETSQTGSTNKEEKDEG